MSYPAGVELVVDSVRRVLGGRVVLDGVSLRLDTEERVVILGASGSGKSTLLRALAGLDPLDGGTVTLDGRRPEDWGLPAWRRQVALVTQRPPLFQETPAQSWAAACRFAAHPDTAAGDPPDVIAARWRLPATAWQRPWARLSGGEAQRAALALALAREPSVLLLDEPTSALDPDTAALVEEDLRARRAIIVTHDPGQADRLSARTMRL